MEWKPSHDRFNKRDLYLVDPFPILPEKAKPDVLKYLTWEHYLEKRKELKAESPPPTDDAPAEAAAHEDEAVLSPVVESSEEVQEEAIPCSWELNEDEVDFYMRQPRALLKKFPHHLYAGELFSMSDANSIILPATDVLNAADPTFQESQHFIAQIATAQSCVLRAYVIRLWTINTSLATLFFEQPFSYLDFLPSGSSISLQTSISHGTTGSGTTIQLVATNVVIRLNEVT